MLRNSNLKLWLDSELTHNYVTPKYTFARTERFKLQSIYWPDKSEKIPENK